MQHLRWQRPIHSSGARYGGRIWRMNLTQTAEQRYLTDAPFHQRVDLIVNDIEIERGVRLDASDRSLATLAAACLATRRS
jgi:hypothetical protein